MLTRGLAWVTSRCGGGASRTDGTATVGLDVVRTRPDAHDSAQRIRVARGVHPAQTLAPAQGATANARQLRLLQVSDGGNCSDRRRPFPHLPRCVALGVPVIQALLVPERVHGLPEPIVAVSQQLIPSHQPRECAHHKVLTVPQVVEDLRPENEESAVDAQSGLLDVLNARHLSVVPRENEVTGQGRPDAKEARDATLPPEPLELRWQWHVSEPVAVVREELG